MEEKEALVISAMKDAGKPVRPGDIAKKNLELIVKRYQK